MIVFILRWYDGMMVFLDVLAQGCFWGFFEASLGCMKGVSGISGVSCSGGVSTVSGGCLMVVLCMSLGVS